MNLGSVLANTFYLRFVPKNVSRFTVSGYKVQTINAGDIPGKQLQIARLRDGHTCAASFSDLQKQMLTETQYIVAMTSWGWELVERDGKQLTFRKPTTKSSKS